MGSQHTGKELVDGCLLFKIRSIHLLLVRWLLGSPKGVGISIEIRVEAFLFVRWFHHAIQIIIIINRWWNAFSTLKMFVVIMTDNHIISTPPPPPPVALFWPKYDMKRKPVANEIPPSNYFLADFLLQPFRKPKRVRTAFSPSQLLKLEHAFESNHYVVGAERKTLAQTLSLTETQVITPHPNENSFMPAFSTTHIGIHLCKWINDTQIK